MTSGSCGPLLVLDVKKGRATIIVCRVISVGGTASSKSNDRTKENRMAFILIFPRESVVGMQPMRRYKRRDSLDESKAVANACMRAGDERQQVAPNAGHRLDCVGNALPTFGSIGAVQAGCIYVVYTDQGTLT